MICAYRKGLPLGTHRCCPWGCHAACCVLLARYALQCMQWYFYHVEFSGGAFFGAWDDEHQNNLMTP